MEGALQSNRHASSIVMYELGHAFGLRKSASVDGTQARDTAFAPNRVFLPVRTRCFCAGSTTRARRQAALFFAAAPDAPLRGSVTQGGLWMISTLMQSIREYKKAAIATPIIVTGEVVM